MIFSRRIGETLQKGIQFNSMDDALRNRLYNLLNRTFPKIYGRYSAYDYLRMYVLDKFGFNTELTDVEEFIAIFMDGEWFVPYDIFELIFMWVDGEDNNPNVNYVDKMDLARRIQDILEEERSGYRLLDYKFTPITNEVELSSLDESTQTRFEPVNTHMKKAIALYSDRTKPDYENSIKESILAVESMCCIITKLPKATLGEALKKLKRNGVMIHGAMEAAFGQLYGYTSDENGIRHGGIDFADAPAEDAKYMLLTCSAFVNYLIQKYAHAGGGRS